MDRCTGKVLKKIRACKLSVWVHTAPKLIMLSYLPRVWVWKKERTLEFSPCCMRSFACAQDDIFLLAQCASSMHLRIRRARQRTSLPYNIHRHSRNCSPDGTREYKFRLDSGRELYKRGGGKLGRKTGYRKSKEEKAEQYAGVIKLLKRGYPVRNIAKIENVGISTVMRLKKEFCD